MSRSLEAAAQGRETASGHQVEARRRRERVEVPILRVIARAYRVPVEQPGASGGEAADGTTMVVVEAAAGGAEGLGYTYASPAAARLIAELLADVVRGRDAMAVPRCWDAMRHAVRSLGRPATARTHAAIAAVDAALWDLKARLLGLPLVRLLGAVRPAVPAYGSGGLTSYSDERLRQQLASWVEAGLRRVKMQVGRGPASDLDRVRIARQAIGPTVELFVDACGALSRESAPAFAERLAELGVIWFEEPVPADDLEGLRLLRDHSPAGMDIAAGEDGHDLYYFRRMLEAKAVDVLQADATCCGGITELLRIGALCEAWPLPLSAHGAPSLHVHPCCAMNAVRHAEVSHHHQRIEHLLFDGAAIPRDGALYPDLSRPGLGLTLKRLEAERYAVSF